MLENLKFCFIFWISKNFGFLVISGYFALWLQDPLLSQSPPSWLFFSSQVLVINTPQHIKSWLSYVDKPFLLNVLKTENFGNSILKTSYLTRNLVDTFALHLFTLSCWRALEPTSWHLFNPRVIMSRLWLPPQPWGTSPTQVANNISVKYLFLIILFALIS